MSTPDAGSEPVELPDELADEGGRSVQIGPGAGGRAEQRSRVFATEPESYVAVLVIEETTEDSAAEPLYEESFVLLTAESEEEAREKAREYGKQHETSYHNENQQLVTWKLKHVVDVKPVEDATFDDGSEIYSRFFRHYEGYSSFETQLSGEEL